MQSFKHSEKAELEQISSLFKRVRKEMKENPIQVSRPPVETMSKRSRFLATILEQDASKADSNSSMLLPSQRNRVNSLRPFRPEYSI